MKVQEDLVWDKNTGEPIGFIDLGDEEINQSMLKEDTKLATHIMVFMVKSVKNPLSFSFANFAKDGATSSQIFPLFWKAVSILKMSCNLKVIATVANGALTNRRFMRMNQVEFILLINFYIQQMLYFKFQLDSQQKIAFFCFRLIIFSIHTLRGLIFAISRIFGLFAKNFGSRHSRKLIDAKFLEFQHSQIFYKKVIDMLRICVNAGIPDRRRLIGMVIKELYLNEKINNLSHKP